MAPLFNIARNFLGGFYVALTSLAASSLFRWLGLTQDTLVRGARDLDALRRAGSQPGFLLCLLLALTWVSRFACCSLSFSVDLFGD